MMHALYFLYNQTMQYYITNLCITKHTNHSQMSQSWFEQTTLNHWRQCRGVCHNTQILLRHVVGHPPPHGWLLGPQIGPKCQIPGLMVSTPPHMVGAQGPGKAPHVVATTFWVLWHGPSWTLLNSGYKWHIYLQIYRLHLYVCTNSPLNFKFKRSFRSWRQLWAYQVETRA